ncbi:MAG: hypothetical protein K2J16_02570 [Clostridia bacterium]|nr:hypothetical protein [Clostridia bacterium]
MEKEKTSVDVIDESAEAQEQEQETGRIVNLRVAKVMLLGASEFVNAKKKTRAVNLVFIDAVEQDKKTGQPIMRGFNPIISCYVKDVDKTVEAFLTKPVFGTHFIKISGDENFTRFHGVLSDAEVAMYRQLMGELADKK